MRVTGRVKWFNDTKGYGFIAHDKGPDAFVHHSKILGSGFKSLREGQEVEFVLQRGEKGWYAEDVTPL